ncbi:MAG TPA: PKD domain-containing protein [Solirubrobacteraceae bacterium]|nr:PKD domain-containing protein [Solirubrobacteraceae bacterium]
MLIRALRRALPVAPSLVLLALAAPAAQAAPAWTAPVALGGTYQGTGVLPLAAVGLDGTTAVGWSEDVSGKQLMKVAVRPPGGTLGAPETISTPGVDASVAQLAVSESGEVIATWLAYDAGKLRVFAAIRPPGGPFGAPVGVSPATSDVDYPAFTEQLAVAPDGAAVLAWGETISGKAEIQYAVRPAGASFGAPVTLPSTSGGAAVSFTVAIARGGAAAIAWSDLMGTSTSGLASVTRGSEASAFGAPAPVAVPAGYVADNVGAGVDAQGDAGIGFTAFQGAFTNVRVYGAARAAGGAWSTPQLLSSTPGGVGPAPRVALDALGTTTVEWFDNASDRDIDVSSRPAGGTFTAAKILASGAGGGWDLLALPGGGATAAWDVLSTGDLQLSTLPAASGFGSPDWSAVSTAAYASQFSNAVQLWLDDAGDPIITYMAADDRMRELAFDAAGPHLDALITPTGAVAGTAAAFSVSPRDDWSGLGVTTWSFGDGSSDGAGTSVTHTFAAPATYQVTVTGRDALGNETSATRAVTVGAASVIAADHTPPVVSHLRLTRARMLIGAGPTALSAATRRPRPKTGTVVQFRLSERASVAVAVQHRKGKTWRTIGTLRRANLAAGSRSLTFSGRLGRKALAKGGYRVSVTATDAAGNRSKPRVASFNVV